MLQWKDPSFPSYFPGLNWVETLCTIDPQAFACCQGRSLRWDARSQIARSCRLQARKQKIDQHLQRFAETWPEVAFSQDLKTPDRKVFFQYLEKVLASELQYGYLTTAQRDGGSPGPFWLLAPLATWRFGISTHVFSMGKSKEHELIPSHIPASEYPLIYFLDGVNELWKPKYAEQVNAIVNWCEHSQVPLWMEVREPLPTMSASDSLDPKEAFRSRIHKLKSRPPLEWLDEECFSRLLRICRKSLAVQVAMET